jgi:hypothetical protein
MKFNKTMRKTIENLICVKTDGKDVLNFLETAYPDNLKPNLNVCLI